MLIALLVMLFSMPMFASPIGIARIDSMESLERLNVSIDREWKVKDTKKSVLLHLIWQLPDYDSPSDPHCVLINSAEEDRSPTRLRFTLVPDAKRKVEARFEVAEDEIGKTKLYFFYGDGSGSVLYLREFIDYFLDDPNAPTKASHSSPDRPESK